ncbi:putative surface antigen [Magnetofaba australis IT-1]|uniref:Outer membrane protein assembly factor BamA n=1 Tax=Magnetofaba australis IT-1 TaxID=1434232 RepID=A0A1Y2K655_9PROT|nr:putative surface antigen [Magnetofaba australis IT-1]
MLMLGLLLAWTAPVQAQTQGGVIDEIRVQGARWIEKETVKSYLSVREGQPFNASDLRKSVKSLYATGFFKNIELEREGAALVVKVVENPLIQEVNFKGAYAFDDEELKDIVKIKARDIFSKSEAEKDLAALRQAYRVKGLFLAQIDLLTKALPENRVELTYKIREGEKSKVREVRLVGNEKLSAKTITKQLVIQPTDWLSWLTEKDTYDREKLLFDQSQVRRVYLDNGYVRARVDSSVAELTPDKKAFVVTHAITEGERYKFGEVEIKSDFDEAPIEDLYKQVEIEKGTWYTQNEVSTTIDKLTDLVGDFGYAFLQISPETAIDDENKTVNLTFNIQKGRRVYVNRVEVIGNTRTRDEVIRREMTVVEGNLFSASAVRKAKKRLQALDFFETVEITTPKSDIPDKVDVQVKVEEKATGAFTLGAGYSTTDKYMGSASVSQNNFMGKGQKLTLSFSLSASRADFGLGLYEPYFMGRDVSAGINLFNRKSDNSDSGGYESDSWGGSVTFGLNLTKNLGTRLSYSLTNTEIKGVASNAALLLRQQEAASPYLTSMVTNELSWDKIDNRLDPMKGHSMMLTTDLAGLGGDVKFLRLTSDNNVYHPIYKRAKVVGHLRLRGGMIEGFGDDVPIFEKYFMGGMRSLRGFKSHGVGPRSYSDDAMGGTYFGSGTAEVQFPVYGLEDKGVSALTFVDVGMLDNFDALATDVNDSGSVRMSAGVGVNWRSPFGPLQFSFGVPLASESWDKTRSFDFSIGTSM